MPYEFYKILHFSGLILTFTSLAGYIFHLAQKNTPEKKKFFAILHGVGLVILLVSGFGLAARLGYVQQLPNWIYVKLAIWLLAGASFALIKRQVLKTTGLYILIVTLAVLGAVTAVTKFI